MSGQSTGVLGRLRQPVELRRTTRQTIGGVPHVSLLPAEVRQAGAAAAQRRKLIALVVVAAILAGGAVGVAEQAESGAQARLAASQQRGQLLAAQVAKFNDVRALESQIAVGKAGVAVGSSTMIDWNAQLDAIQADMPEGYTVTSLNANGATPFAVYPQGTSLLEPLRAATIEMKLTSRTAGNEFSAWYLSLKRIPAYADASATTDYDPGTALWTISLTVHLRPSAISAGPWKDES